MAVTRTRKMALTLTAPVRRDIVRALNDNMGPMTTDQLAEQLICDSSQISYQCKVLSDYRLVAEIGKSRDDDSPELWISLVLDDEVINTSLALLQDADSQLLHQRQERRPAA
jgi:hypothetical protein